MQRPYVFRLEENKRVARKMIEALNKRDLVSLDELVDRDYVDHYHQLQGLDNYKQFLSVLLKAFPDWDETIEGIIAEGDQVWFRFRATATHTGDYHGYFPLAGKEITLAPTGRKITPVGYVAYRIFDGKIVEGWEISNLFEIYLQLGIIEPTEKSKELFSK